MASVVTKAGQLDRAAKLLGYSSRSYRYRVRGTFLFSGINLVDSNVLKVG